MAVPNPVEVALARAVEASIQVWVRLGTEHTLAFGRLRFLTLDYRIMERPAGGAVKTGEVSGGSGPG